jgi:chitinase
MDRRIGAPAALAVVVVVVAGALLVTARRSSAPQAPPALPAHTITGYWQNFADDGTVNLRLRDVPARYGIVAVAFADATSEPGGVTFALDPSLSADLGGYDAAEFRADVAALRAQGRKVVLSVGGEDGAISVPDAASATRFATDVLGLMRSWGFDGVDIDLENAPDLRHLAPALRRLAADAGPGFVLTMAPETVYVQPGGSYLRLIDQVRDLVTVVNTQYYNSGSMLGRDGREYHAGTVDFLTALADLLLDGHLRPDQVGLGLPATPAAAGNGYVDPSVVGDALSCLALGERCGSYRPAARYPAIRGAMTWSVNWDAANGFRFANTVGAHLDTLPGGGRQNAERGDGRG